MYCWFCIVIISSATTFLSIKAQNQCRNLFSTNSATAVDDLHGGKCVDSSISTRGRSLVGTGISNMRSRSLDSINDTKVIKTSRVIQSTKPQGPRLRVDERSKNSTRQRHASTADIEKEKQEKSKIEQELKRKKALLLYKKMKVASRHVVDPCKSVKILTIPRTPKLRLDAKHGKKKYSTTHVEIPPTKQLFTQTGTKENTIPMPFQLATEIRAKTRGDSIQSESAPTAGEQMHNFSFRSSHIPSISQQPTIPVAPTFRTDARLENHTRPKPPSREEIEEKQMQEFQHHQFKHKPVDHKIFESAGELGVPKVQPKTVTEPEPFNLRIDRRPKRQSQLLPDDAVVKAFIALPMPDFSSTSSLPPPPPVQRLTVPQSPKLANGKVRAASAPPARQMPHHSVAEQMRAKHLNEATTRIGAKSSPLRHTDPRSPNLATSERGRVYKAQFEEQIRKEEEERVKAREVQAQPVPIFTKPMVAKSTTLKPVTQFDEFKLRSQIRHEHYDSKFQEKLKTEEAEFQREFHALPLPKTTFAADFSVVLDGINKVSSIAPQAVSLETDVRATRRKLAEQEWAQKRKEEEETSRRREKEKEDQENLIIRQLRRKSHLEGGMTFKAAKIVTVDKFPSKLVEKPALTVPVSPQFSINKRLALRASMNANMNLKDGASSTTSVSDVCNAVL